MNEFDYDATKNISTCEKQLTRTIEETKNDLMENTQAMKTMDRTDIIEHPQVISVPENINLKEGIESSIPKTFTEQSSTKDTAIKEVY